MTERKQKNENTFFFYIFRAVIFCINFGTALFACRKFTKSQLIYKIYVCLWIMLLIAAVLYMQLYYIQTSDLTVGTAIYFLLHVAEMIVHLVIIFESFAMDSKRADVTKMYRAFEKRFNCEWNTTSNYQRFNHGWLLTILSFVAMIATAVHAIQMWTANQVSMATNLLYWNAMPSTMALQFRILELIAAINFLNEFAIKLRKGLNEMGERNIRRVFWRHLRGRAFAKLGIVRIVMPQSNQPNEEDDERKLRACKKFYDDIYFMFKTVTDSYGWSLSAFMIMYFIYLVIHAYWVFYALGIFSAQYPKLCLLINNLKMLVIVVILLWILCWQSQISHEQSRQIGCNMFKLVKPLGKKSYNDLVTNFSLQTLHQQYIITAKEFFNLNLNHLGSMFASIAIYLIILIQFMFAEKEKNERNKILTSLVNTGNSTSG